MSKRLPPQTVSKKKRHYTQTLSKEQIDRELFLLIEEAVTVYKEEVINGGKNYDRYVSDFIDLRFDIDGDAATRNAHRRNRNITLELLTRRKDLVMSAFRSNDFTTEEFEKMMHAFDTCSAPSFPRQKHISNARPLVVGNALDDEQIALITRLAKENNLFLVDNITEKHIRFLFSCEPDFRIHANYLCGISLLFDRLMWNGIIHPRWQSILGKTKMILRKDDDKPICANTFSTSLSKARWSSSEASVKMKDSLDRYFPKRFVDGKNIADAKP